MLSDGFHTHLHTFDYGLFSLQDRDIGLTVGMVTTGCLTPPLVHVCSEVRVCASLNFAFFIGLLRMITVRYLLIWVVH